MSYYILNDLWVVVQCMRGIASVWCLRQPPVIYHQPFGVSVVRRGRGSFPIAYSLQMWVKGWWYKRSSGLVALEEILFRQIMTCIDGNFPEKLSMIRFALHSTSLGRGIEKHCVLNDFFANHFHPYIENCPTSLWGKVTSGVTHVSTQYNLVPL